ncbi:MAG TPA: hypothetical protein VGL53_19085 [Bryobacteraceae bacterium]
MLTTVGLTTSCTRLPSQQRWPHQMGDRVQVGWFSYTVLELEYKSQLGDSPVAPRPKNTYIAIHLQATSSAGNTVSVPFMRLETESGDFIPEVEDASALPGWFGLFRSVEPAATESGWIVFDAAPANYGLRLSDGVLDDEKTAMVRIPLRIDAGLK